MPIQRAREHGPDSQGPKRRDAAARGTSARKRDRMFRGIALLALFAVPAQAVLAETGGAGADAGTPAGATAGAAEVATVTGATPSSKQAFDGTTGGMTDATTHGTTGGTTTHGLSSFSAAAAVGTDAHSDVLGRPRDREPVKPIEALEVDAGKTALGRALFLDPGLSKDGTVACASCHDLAGGGDDGRAVSVGIGGNAGTINAPTVFNAVLNFKQFWDGRADTLDEQIDGPVQSPVEMGSLWPEVVARLHAHDTYPDRFREVYPDGINRANVKDALVEFMKSLTTPNSRFDRWLKGDDDALSAVEERGYTLFKLYGCVSCHQGANVGGNMFQVFGVHNDYFEKRGEISDADLGRFNVTGTPADRHSFKVPSLRMAALTAPYLHDGSAETLRDAVDAMFEFQLGREAPDADKVAIIAFIEALAGEHPELSP